MLLKSEYLLICCEYKNKIFLNQIKPLYTFGVKEIRKLFHLETVFIHPKRGDAF